MHRICLLELELMFALEGMQGPRMGWSQCNNWAALDNHLLLLEGVDLMEVYN